jgi:hypothetical protein
MSSLLLKAFTIYDAKTDVYSEPFFSPNKAAAMRMAYVQMQRDPQHPWVLFSSDYGIFEIGEFRVDTGVYTAYPGKESVALMWEISEYFAPNDQGATNMGEE